jgi:hypothetical protein
MNATLQLSITGALSLALGTMGTASGAQGGAVGFAAPAVASPSPLVGKVQDQLYHLPPWSGCSRHYGHRRGWRNPQYVYYGFPNYGHPRCYVRRHLYYPDDYDYELTYRANGNSYYRAHQKNYYYGEHYYPYPIYTSYPAYSYGYPAASSCVPLDSFGGGCGGLFR